MTERYNAIECEMGISTYASKDHEGFAAVSKARYSDFVVHEVDNNGNVARLQSLQYEEKKEPAETNEASRKRKFDADKTAEAPPQDSEEMWTSAREKLTQWVGEDVAVKVVTMLQYWESNESGQEEKNVTLPAIAEKDIRRNLHEWIRSSLKCARADTVDGKVRIWHKRFEKEMPNYGKFDRISSNNNNRPPKKKWPTDRPDFLRFVLYKENADTSAAVKEICKRLSRGKKQKIRVGYAGMKDKRGITSQFCTLYKREPSEIIGLNQQRSGGGGNSSQGGVSLVRVGNFDYVDQELSLGSLQGNRFDVVLRNVEVSSDTKENRIQHTEECLKKAALNLKNHGFINYFGMQRFGKYYDTAKVGIAVLKGDFEAAVKIILQPKPDEPPRFEKARKLWDVRFDGLAKDASLEEKQKAESSCAKQALRDIGRFMTCEVSILNSLMRKPLDYKRAFACIPKNLRMMFLHALQSYVWNHVSSHRIDTLGRQAVVVGDLVLTHDKTEQEGGSGTSGLEGKAVKVVDENDVASGMYAITDLVLPLVGTKVQYPQNSCGELIDSLLKKEGLTKESFSKVQDRELSLGGDYRKVICKPSDVDYEIKKYYDPLQPLLQTDLMKLNNISLETPLATESATNETKEAKESSKAPILAMIVGFTLPASSYATIALRELMKRPTSSDYQRKLVLEGPCEQNIKEEDKK